MKDNNKIKEFLTEGTDMDTLDATLKSWVTQTMDGELRDKMAQALDDQYGVKRTNNKSFVLRHIRPILSMAASLALLVTLYFINQNTTSANGLASEYLDAQTILHPGSFKGIAESDVNRTQGIVAFNNSDFAKAAIHFERITEPNKEDNHYLGLAYLKSKQHAKAIDLLKKGATENSRFGEEANWFLSLAYILDGQGAAAKRQLVKINKGDWQFDKAQELLKKMEH